MIPDLLRQLLFTSLDVALVIAIVFGFQWLVVRRPLPDPSRTILGFGMVVLGLALFMIGLDLALFPMGAMIPEQLVADDVLPALADGAARHWRDYAWIYAFALAIGISTTIAEPALIAVAMKAEECSGGTINAFWLRVAVAIGVGIGITLGAWRIVTGAPLHWFIMGAYALVILQTFCAPRRIIPLAYDSGGVTTSTITVPIIAALGLGLAGAIEGRDALMDGFGMIALACLFPIITVMGYAQLVALKQYRSRLARQDRPVGQDEGVP